ncbi:TetR/AcrR family transcriptional regulator [Comamonas aquatica]|uniref:TetR/AcrR family transcriptional regulator n=1 Tax=Comamonas aquatica TaxID=225991 RepID=UPI00244AC1DB|nr:TetR/AcrR family transcriptional regulator [Comamonas aquatica]MDH1766782.1 TetR/AcrR family transcriptional regulator [Comamonas aquatica]
MNIQTPVASERTTGRYHQKREAILNAATQLFDEYGIKGTMLSEVANKVGLSTNSITYYFKKKEDLVFECLMHTINTIGAITERAAAGPTPAERVRLFVCAFVDMLAECHAGRHPAIMSFRDVGELDASYTKVIFASYREMFRRVRNLLVEGELQTGNRMALTTRTHLLLTLTQWSRFWLAGFSLNSYPRIADHMVDIILNGLSGSGSRWGKNAVDRQLASLKIPDAPNQGFLAAAINLINEVGYDGASIDRISARMSVTKGSFYHHIPSKEDLFAECIRRTTSVVDTMQNLALQCDSNGFEKLSALSRALVDFHFSPRGPLLRVSAWSELSNYSHFHDRVQPLREFTQNVTDIFAIGMIDGSLRPTHQQVAALMVVGMITGATTLDKWVPGAEKTNTTEIYLRPFFEGICCPI